MGLYGIYFLFTLTLFVRFLSAVQTVQVRLNGLLFALVITVARSVIFVITVAYSIIFFITFVRYFLLMSVITFVCSFL